MAESSEPRKETVRIALPTQAAGDSSGETVRIKLPPRPPTNVPAPPTAPSPPSNVPEPPPAPPIMPSPAMQGPRKETARVASPTGQTAPTVQMKKTQPLVTMPDTMEPPLVPMTVTRDTEISIETIPVGLCWAVLAFSALILMIQIWNYFS